jgi:hypothetical protein
VPRFCSASCRQAAYHRRTFAKRGPVPLHLLASDLSIVRLRAIVREEVARLLAAAGLPIAEPAPKKKLALSVVEPTAD